MDNAPLLDFQRIQSLDYPPNHPLTLALEFTNCSAQENEAGIYSNIIAGWIRDQRPAFAIKMILDNKGRELFGDLCAFARSAAGTLEEPEPLLRAMESLFVVRTDRNFGPNQYEMCQYRCCICEGYAESDRLSRVPAWLSRINQQNSYEAAIHRVTAILLQKWPLEKVEDWGESLPAGPGAIVFWTSIAQVRLRRREIDAVADLINRKLGGSSGTPLQVVSGFVDLLRKANRRSEVEEWTECALAHIRSGFNQAGAYLPFEIVCACQWLGRHQDVEYLWPLYESYTRRNSSFLAGKGCYRSAIDHYLWHFDMASTAGFSDLADRVAGLYKEFMASSNSPPKTLAAAKEELLGRSRRRHVPDNPVTQPPQSTGSLDLEATIQEADTLPERQREALLCRLCDISINSRQWDDAIAALIKIAELPNPLNGPGYVREMARRICIGAGHFEVLTERNFADLRSILARLQRPE